MAKKKLAVVAIILLFLAWAPWMNDEKLTKWAIEKRAPIDGTRLEDGSILCEYNSMWMPFGRWIASCEGGYYVNFLQEVAIQQE